MEVVVLGFLAQPVHYLLSVFGVKGKERRTIVKNISETAERASNWLWIKSGDINWSVYRIKGPKHASTDPTEDII